MGADEPADCKAGLRRMSEQMIGRAWVAELVYAQDLKSWARNGLRVRFPPQAPIKEQHDK